MTFEENNSVQERELIPAILSHFGITEAVVKVVDQKSFANKNYLVKTVKNDFIVKFLVEQVKEEIINDVEIQKQLNSAGIATATYLKGKDGEYNYNHGNLSAVVSKKIEGVIPESIDEKLATEIGMTLAKFHTSVVRLNHARVAWLNPKIVGYNVEGASIYSNILPKGIIHADLHRENLLVDIDSNHVAAIFDFEESEENLYIVDIARTILGTCYSQANNKLEKNLILAFLKGYISIKTLTDEEINSLSLAVSYTTEACIKWFKSRGFDDYVKIFSFRAGTFPKDLFI